ncbi:MAG: immunoglobulin [Bacillota bacterium]|jgi:hypothetical protein
MKLLPDERETIILWSDAEDTASIFTHDRKLISRLKQLSQKYPDKFYADRKEHPGAVSYIVPKNCISLHSPFSEERRKKLSEKAKMAGRQPPPRQKEE